MSTAFEARFTETAWPQHKAEHGETIGYKSLSATSDSAVSWATIDGAIVNRNAEVRGGTDILGRVPIEVVFGDDDIAIPAESIDKIRLDADDGKVYLVSQREPAGDQWELYCV